MLLTRPSAGDATGPGLNAGVDPCVQAQIGDVTLGATDSHGVSWTLTNLDGWKGLASNSEARKRPASHGGWLNEATYEARVITLEGRVVTDSWRDGSLAADELLAQVPVDGLVPLVVSEPERALRALVRQHEQPLVRREVGGEHVVYSLSLIAPDPRRYSVTQHQASTGLPSTSGGLSLPVTVPFSLGATVTSGVIVAHNDGKMSTPPVLTVRGPIGPFSVTHRGTGEVLSYHGSDVTAGRFLTLDVRSRQALLDGTAVRPVSGSWFTLAPGDNEIAFGGSSMGGGGGGFSAFGFGARSAQPTSLLVEWRDAWR